MEWLLGLALLTVAGTLALTTTAFSGVQGGVRAQARRRLAEDAGLTDVVAEDAGTVSGRLGALRVRFETVRGGASGTTRVVIDGVVRGVGIAPAAGRAPVPGEVVIGDPFLDAALVLEGVPATVRGLLDADVRARARKAFRLQAKVHVAGGALVAEFQEGMFGAAPRQAELAVLLDLARALAPGDPDEWRLAQIVRTDPMPSVREHALESLVKEAPDHPFTLPALREAVNDASPEVRLRAACGLGAQGHEVLYALAADPDVDDALATAAVEALGDGLTLARIQPLLEAAVTDLRVPVVRALLRSMAGGGAPVARVVASVLARRIGKESSLLSAAGAEIAVAAATALGGMRTPEVEGVLIAALASAVVGVPVAAAGSLGRVGTARAIPALRDAEEQGGELRRAARTSIAAIRSRLTGATPGQVSIADGEAGRVSVAEPAEGGVSLDEP